MITNNAKDVSDFHNNSDRDSSPQAQHHTLGMTPMQAAPGDHKWKQHKDWLDYEHANVIWSPSVNPNNVLTQVYRYGRVVDLVFEFTVAINWVAGNAFFSVPPGYLPLNDRVFWAANGSTGTPALGKLFLSTGDFTVYSSVPTAGQQIAGSVSFLRDL